MLIMLFILIAVLVPLINHFLSITDKLPDCKVVHYDGANYFQPRCFTCQEGFSVIDGACQIA
jgi:hypothetical protein